MKRSARIAAAVLATFVAVPLTFVPGASGASAQGESVVREVVVAQLAPDGTVESTSVAQLIRLDAGDAVSVADSADVASYRDLSGFDAPEMRDGRYTWRAKTRRDTVALADVEGDLPLRVEPTYYLGGEEVAADDVKGKDGLVRIELELTNTTRDTKTVDYTSVTGEQSSRDTIVYTPLEYSVRIEFAKDMWRDLKVGDAYVQTDSQGTQIVVRPGALSPPVGPRSETLSFEARGTDILLPRIRVAAFPRTSPLADPALAEQYAAAEGLYGAIGSAYGTLTSVYEGTLLVSSGLDGVLVGLGSRDPATGEPVVTLGSNGLPTTVIGTLGFARNTLRDQLIPGIGTRDPATGKAIVTLKDGVPTTVLGALGFAKTSIDEQLLPAIGSLDQSTGRATTGPATLLGGLQASKDAYDKQLIPAMQGVIIPSLQQLRKGAADGQALATALSQPQLAGIFGALAAGMDQFQAQALSNPEFTKPQPEIGNVVPLQYYLQCVACFSPASSRFDERMADPADPKKIAAKFVPALNETFQLFSIQTGAAMKALNTGDPAKPGLVEGLQLLSGGVGALIGQIQTLDPSKPGVVEGMALLRDGLTTLINTVHTLDASKPGVVDGLQQLKAGVGQASQGLFAVNELVLRGARSGVQQSGDNVALDRAVIERQQQDIEGSAFLAAGADETFVSYVFDIAPQSTTARDNAVRGGFIAFGAIAAVLLGRRAWLAA